MLSADMDNNLSSSSLETISCPLLPFFSETHYSKWKIHRKETVLPYFDNRRMMILPAAEETRTSKGKRSVFLPFPNLEATTR